MSKFKCLIYLVFFLCHLHLVGQVATFSPENSLPIHKDSSAIVAWATECMVQRGAVRIDDTTVTYDGLGVASSGAVSDVLGKADNKTISLGDGGQAILTFNHAVSNGEGPDFAVFENSFDGKFLELAFVEVSSNGEHFVRFPAISKIPNEIQLGGFEPTNPNLTYNLAGDCKALFGTPFDLEELKDSTGIDINNITHLKIVDVIGCIDPAFCSFDSEGNIINDPWPTPFHTGGFDLDAVGVIHQSGTTMAQVPEISEVMVFPNPVKDRMYVKGLQVGAEGVITDMLGRQVLKMQPGELFSSGIRMGYLPEGYYLLHLVNNEQHKVRKFFKTRF